MRRQNLSGSLAVVLLLSGGGVLASCQSDIGNASVSAASAAAQVGQSAGASNAEERLSEEVMRRIAVIQEALVAGSEAGGSETDLRPAKTELDRLYADLFATSNGFEQVTILNFYTNYYLTLQDYPNTILIFEQILGLPDVRADIRLRTLRSLGQLYGVEERWEESLACYEAWRDAADDEDAVVYRGIAYAHYQLGELELALPPWRAYMDLREESGEALTRADYAYLNGLYFSLERYEEALETTKQMILQFNDDKDWQNLRALFEALDEPAPDFELGTSDV